MNKLDKDKIIGIIATVLFHAVLIALPVFGFLYYSYPPKDEELAKLDNDEILFGGEYVTYGDFNTTMNDAPIASSEAPAKKTVVEGEDATNEGAVGEAEPQLVTSTEESPMKVKEKENPGPTKEEIEAEQERVRKEEEKRKSINKRVNFGNTKGSGEGKSGVVDAPKTSNPANQKPGVNGLVGYTLDKWSKPSSTKTGTIIVRVKVNARGQVVDARYQRGSGNANVDNNLRRLCEQESMKCTFSVPQNTTTEAVGEIVWKFDQKD